MPVNRTNLTILLLYRGMGDAPIRRRRCRVMSRVVFVAESPSHECASNRVRFWPGRVGAR